MIICKVNVQFSLCLMYRTCHLERKVGVLISVCLIILGFFCCLFCLLSSWWIIVFEQVEQTPSCQDTVSESIEFRQEDYVPGDAMDCKLQQETLCVKLYLSSKTHQVSGDAAGCTGTDPGLQAAQLAPKTSICASPWLKTQPQTFPSFSR